MKGYRKRGNKWYFTMYVGNGKSIERLGGDTLEEAINSKAKAIEELHADGMAVKKNTATVTDVIDEWLDYHSRDIRANTMANYITNINRMRGEEWMSWRVTRLSPKVLQSYIDRISEKYSRSSVNTSFSVLGQALDYAVYPLQYIKESPMHYVKRHRNRKSVLEMIGKEDSLKGKTITLNQFREIRDAMPKEYRIVLDIGMYTGCRIGEACALTWDDVDLIGKTISITKSMSYNNRLKIWEISPTKTSDRRMLSISDALVKILREQSLWQKECRLASGRRFVEPQIALVRHGMDESLQIVYDGIGEPYRAICTHPHGDIIYSRVLTNKISAMQKAGIIPHFHFHMLRHTHATLLLANGTPPKDVQERLGHRMLTTTMDIYGHTTEESRRSAANLFDKIMND